MGLEIDYALFAKAISFYKEKGYEYIETPWIVSEDVLLKTTSKDRITYVSPKKGLVGSAEQGFIALSKNLKPNKLYVSAGPCFRQADEGRSPVHHAYFMKVELFSYTTPFSKAPPMLSTIIEDAIQFFLSIAKNSSLVKIKPTLEGFDIEYNNVEVGSYGNRTINNKLISYGTGLALPRFSQL